MPVFLNGNFDFLLLLLLQQHPTINIAPVTVTVFTNQPVVRENTHFFSYFSNRDSLFLSGSTQAHHRQLDNRALATLQQSTKKQTAETTTAAEKFVCAKNSLDWLCILNILFATVASTRVTTAASPFFFSHCLSSFIHSFILSFFLLFVLESPKILILFSAALELLLLLPIFHFEQAAKPSSLSH